MGGGLMSASMICHRLVRGGGRCNRDRGHVGRCRQIGAEEAARNYRRGVGTLRALYVALKVPGAKKDRPK
jgi:hypothetical protein